MFKRFLKLAFRNLINQRQITFICILGLAIALAVVLQISNWIQFELSYDKFHSKEDRIYRFTVEENRPEENFYWHFARCWQPWRTKLPEFFPQIERLVELRPMWHTAVRTSDNLFYSNRAFAVDSSVFNVFDFKFINGDPRIALIQENSVVISESMAKKLFSNKDAINQVVELNGEGLEGYEKHIITGVFKDLPANSHFHVDMFVCNKNHNTNGNDFAYTYLLLRKGTSIDQLIKLNDKFIKAHVPGDQQRGSFIHYTPLTDIHLKSHIERELELNGDIRQIKLFIYIGIGILFIAFINFFNLMMALTDKRRRYFNINIIIGGKQKHNSFLACLESLMIAFIVIVFAIILFKPVTNFLSVTLLEKSIPVTINYIFIIIVLVFLLMVLLLGTLPVYLTKINLSESLSKYSTGKHAESKSWVLKNPVLVIQFMLSIIVIISSLVLNKQNNFLFSRNLGCGNNNILMVERNFWKEEPEVMLFKDELKKLPVVEDVSMCMDPPGYLVKDARAIEYADIPAENRSLIINILPVDGNFFSFFNLPMVAGNSQEYLNGQTYENYVLNEAAIKKLGFNSPAEVVGTKFKIRNFGDQTVIKGGTIVGVVKDFNFTSLYSPIEPTIFFSKPIWQWKYLVKLAPGDKNANIDQIKKVWENVFPEYPFEYEFLDDIYKEYYAKDIVTNKLVGWFSFICIILSSIGLWGISSILIARRTKEIGIHKVNGARTKEVLVLLNTLFVKWVIVAFIVAVPIAWYVMHKWLENFAYKTEMSWWIFALAGIIALAVAILTVSLKCWSAATRNPVEALRYE